MQRKDKNHIKSAHISQRSFLYGEFVDDTNNNNTSHKDKRHKDKEQKTELQVMKELSDTVRSVTATLQMSNISKT